MSKHVLRNINITILLGKNINCCGSLGNVHLVFYCLASALCITCFQSFSVFSYFYVGVMSNDLTDETECKR